MDDDDCVPLLVDDDEVATAVAAATAAAAASAAVQPATTAPVVTVNPPAAAPGYVRDPADPPVPLTILTGWLGSGKTTLLTRILTHFSSLGLKLAIVQNEASSFGVEAGLRVANSSTGEDSVFSDMLEFSNGCVCCAIKSDFVLGVEALLARKRFDYIVLECSGLADPGPLAQMFWVDPELESSVYLDGIVSVVDAKNFLGHLRPPNGNNGGDAGSLEAQQVIHQVAYADRVLLNKLDLVGTAERDECEREIRRINQSAPILTSVRSEVNLDQLLHIHAFDVNDTTRAVIMPPLEAVSQDQPSGSGDSAPVAAHPHDDSIRTFMVDDLAVAPAQRRAVSLPALKRWMGDLLWRDAIDSEQDDAASSADAAAPAPAAAAATGDAAAASSSNAATAAATAAAALATRPNCLFRVKAIMRLEGQNNPTFLQAVQALYDLQPGKDWPADGPAATAATAAGAAVTDPAAAARFTRFVFIGRRLDHDSLRQGFESIFVQ